LAVSAARPVSRERSWAGRDGRRAVMSLPGRLDEPFARSTKVTIRRRREPARRGFEPGAGRTVKPGTP
jgi:hypothetical protein